MTEIAAFLLARAHPAEERAAGLTLLGYGIVLSIIARNAWALVRLATVIADAAPPAGKRFRSAGTAREPVGAA